MKSPHAHYEETSSRYRAMVFYKRTPEENAALEADIDSRFAKLFGDKPYTPQSGYLDRQYEGNGEVETRQPREFWAWREMVAKARRDIELHKSECKLRAMASAITVSEALIDIEEIRAWAKSLLKAT